MLAHLKQKLNRKVESFRRPPTLSSVRMGDRVWHLTPLASEWFGSNGPQLERWVADGIARVVKANPARTVYRVELAVGTVFVKHCRVINSRAWAREIVRLPKAQLEFDNALALRERGVPAVEPLAWGAPDSSWPCESFVITRGAAGVPFVDYLAHDFLALAPHEQQATRRKLAVALAEFLAHLHDAGVAHPDPHPGNLLVESCAGNGVRFSLIDLHGVQLGQPLSWHKSRDNLALFNRFFQVRTHRPERFRFWQAYQRTRVARDLCQATETREQAKELERATHTSNLRLWAGREKRWIGTSRAVRRVKANGGAIDGFAVRDLSDDFLQGLLANPDAAFNRPDARLLKDCSSSTVAQLQMPSPCGAVPVLFKRVNTRSWVDPVKNVFRKSPALRSWMNGHALRDRWLPTPRPLAVFHHHRLGFPTTGYLLTEMVPQAVQLDDAVRAGFDRDAAFRLARVLRQMHDRGVSHRDLKAANVLLGHGKEPALIDLVGVRTQTTLTMARRAKELSRLNASFLLAGVLSRTQRLQFLQGYLSAGPLFEEGWKSWWNLVSRETMAKVARNARKGRPVG